MIRMLETLLPLLMQSLLLMLRVSGGDSFPRPLSPEEERDCLERLRRGNPEARNTLVEHNLRLVAHITRKYYAQTGDTDDLISIGTIGLIKGVDSYDPAKGVKLASYCSRCIENEILMALRSRRKAAGEVSLSEALDADGEGEGLSLLDVIAREDDLAERLGTLELCRELRRQLETCLTEREGRVLRLRYGLDGGEERTQQQVSELLGISRSYVSRIEKKALRKLREAMEE